jgi:hypothetical protein
MVDILQSHPELTAVIVGETLRRTDVNRQAGHGPTETKEVLLSVLAEVKTCAELLGSVKS